MLEKIDKKIVTLSRFWTLRESKEWSWVNLFEKENLRRKSFSDNLFRSMKSKKSEKLISTDIKTDVKQEINKLVVVSYNRNPF